MNIKQTADASGVSARNIRYYEQAALLAPARNPENDYRIYTDADVRTLKLIRVLRTLDMPVEDIRAVLSGTMPLTEAAERQRRQLEAEQQSWQRLQPLHGAGRGRQNGGRAGCGRLPGSDGLPCPGGRLVYRLGAGLPENGGCRA